MHTPLMLPLLNQRFSSEVFPRREAIRAKENPLDGDTAALVAEFEEWVQTLASDSKPPIAFGRKEQDVLHC